jgi:hypothetical protein
MFDSRYGGSCHFVTTHIPAIGLPIFRANGKRFGKKEELIVKKKEMAVGGRERERYIK